MLISFFIKKKKNLSFQAIYIPIKMKSQSENFKNKKRKEKINKRNYVIFL